MSGSVTTEDRNTVKKLVEQALLNKVFIGCHTGRRLVEPLIAYKDIMEVDPEGEFINILRVVNDKIRKSFDGKFVNCIVGSVEEGFCILTDVSVDASGPRRFQVENVEFNDLGLAIDVKLLKSSDVETEPFFVKLWNDINVSKFVDCDVLSQLLTPENIISFVKLLGPLCISILAGSYRLLELMLRYFAELNNTLKILQPVVVELVKAITKLFGGLLLIINFICGSQCARNQQNWEGEYQPLEYRPHQKNGGGRSTKIVFTILSAIAGVIFREFIYNRANNYSPSSYEELQYN